LTIGANPAVKASYHLEAQSAHLSPGFKPGNAGGWGVCKDWEKYGLIPT